MTIVTKSLEEIARNSAKVVRVEPEWSLVRWQDFCIARNREINLRGHHEMGTRIISTKEAERA
jgi:hypothetical protein